MLVVLALAEIERTARQDGCGSGMGRLEIMSAERGWNRVCGRTPRPYQLEQYGLSRKATTNSGSPASAPWTMAGGKLTHNTLSELYFSGWPAYFRMPSF